MSEQWIRVAERLPALEDGFVLLAINFHEPHVRRAARLGYYEPRDEAWRTQMGRIRAHWEVTHWMPLPELPDE